MKARYAFRSAEPEDIAFILDSWLRSYHNHGFVQYKDHREVVLRLLEANQPIVCCDEAQSDVILGWICSEGGNWLHYVYVKAPFRRLGIASRLLEAAGFPPDKKILCSHVTYSFEFLNLEAKLLEDAHVVVEPARDPTSRWRVSGQPRSKALQGGRSNGGRKARQVYRAVPRVSDHSPGARGDATQEQPTPTGIREVDPVGRGCRGGSDSGIGRDVGRGVASNTASATDDGSENATFTAPRKG